MLSPSGLRSAVFALAFALAASRPASLPAIAFDPSPPTIAANFVSLLANGDFAAAESGLNSMMRTAAPASRLRQIWQGLVAQYGRFNHRAGVSQFSAGGYRNVLVTCVFARASADLVVSVDRAGKIGGLHVTNVQHTSAFAPPSYANSARFHERALTVGHAPWAIPGTLSMPNGRGPFPAVVLVAGSGPEDRDETIDADKPFRDIAWGLASQGIAVLRYDKRTLVYHSRIAHLSEFTIRDEYMTDAEAAVSLLARTPNINRRAIYLLGHSEGGMVAPRIGREDAQIAGLIMMAAPARPLVDVIGSQFTYLHSRDLVSAAGLAEVTAQVAQIKALTLADRAHKTNLLGAPPSYWLELRSYRQTAVARALTIPTLIMQGTRDYQVTMTDFQIWKSALKARPHVTFKSYTDLFHPFIQVPAGSPTGLATPAAYAHPGYVAAQVIRDLIAWVKTRGSR
jgi:fermentation-respiration switch protein FrsA (DUF1100 family)